MRANVDHHMVAGSPVLPILFLTTMTGYLSPKTDVKEIGVKEIGEVAIDLHQLTPPMMLVRDAGFVMRATTTALTVDGADQLSAIRVERLATRRNFAVLATRMLAMTLVPSLRSPVVSL